VRWVPTRAFASTTNLFTVRVTDNGAPAMSATQSFTVIVLDYLELTIGSTNSQAGQIVSVPITLASDRGVADLSFSIPWAPGYFTNAALSFTAPGVASGSLQNQTTNLLITMQTVPSQALQGTQQLAQLSFLAISNQQSAFIQLPFASPLAAKPDGSVYENYILHPGSVAAVQNQALLLPGRSLTGGRELTLFGKLGISYELQYATNVSSPTAWYPKLTYTQTNGLMTLDLDSANPSIFYRLLEQ
jgi:hypothetical protein